MTVMPEPDPSRRGRLIWTIVLVALLAFFVVGALGGLSSLDLGCQSWRGKIGG